MKKGPLCQWQSYHSFAFVIWSLAGARGATVRAPRLFCFSCSSRLPADLKNKGIKWMGEFEEIPVSVHLPLQLLHSHATHDIMENFAGSSSLKWNAVLLSLFWEMAGIVPSKNTNLNHKIPQALSPSALWCERHIHQLDLGWERI